MRCFCGNGFLILISCFIFAHCSKSTGNSGGNNTLHAQDGLYMLPAIMEPIAFYGKTAFATRFHATTGSANEVLLSGSDVYVSGVYQEIKMYASRGVLSGPVTGESV